MMSDIKKQSTDANALEEERREGKITAKNPQTDANDIPSNDLVKELKGTITPTPITEPTAMIEPTLDELDRYYHLPVNSATHVIKKALNNPSRVRGTKPGQIKEDTHYMTGETSIIYKGSDNEITLTLGETKKLFAKRIQNGAKVFNFLLRNLNMQKQKDRTIFTLQELVDAGIYANKDSAKKGMTKILEKMYAMSIDGTTTEYEKGKRQVKTFARSRIISSFGVSSKECFVEITSLIRNALKYITILPEWSNRLNDNAYMLLDYIYYMARVNNSTIDDSGSFTISIETIRVHLGLPTVEEAGDDPKRLIFEPIEKAIKEIEETATSLKDIILTPSYDPNEYKDIQSYLREKITITLDEKGIAYMKSRSIAQDEAYNKAQEVQKSKRQLSNNSSDPQQKQN